MDSQNNLSFERVAVFSPEPHCTFYPMGGSILAVVFLKPSSNTRIRL